MGWGIFGVADGELDERVGEFAAVGKAEAGEVGGEDFWAVVEGVVYVVCFELFVSFVCSKMVAAAWEAE